jgi:CubicO group peptidase (beta-lactamase class C family)
VVVAARSSVHWTAVVPVIVPMVGERARRVLASVLLGCVAAAAASCAPDPSSPSVSPSPSAAAAAVQAAVQEHLEARQLSGMGALLVAVDGQLLLERYWDSAPGEHLDTLSVTKSITGALVGAALADGSLQGLDQPLVELLPDQAGRMSPAVAAVTLRQLLTMTSGLPGDGSKLAAWVDGDDWVGDILTAGVVTDPGTRFAYSNSASHLLAAVVAEATGRSVLDYARDVLFDPLGIDTRPATTVVVTEDPESARYESAPGFVWPQDPQGVHTGFGWAKLTAGDMLAFGQLHLDRGRWNGRQVLPAEWVTQATSPHVPLQGVPGMKHYGYQWWITTADGHPAAAAWGFGGQLIEIVPDLGLVVVVSTPVGETPVFTTPAPLLNLIDQAIAPAASDSA